MKIYDKKLVAAIELILLLLIQAIIVSNLINKPFEEVDDALRSLTFLSVISLLFYFITWKYMTNEIFSPYTVFLIVLWVFCCGQTVGWLFNLDLGTKDLFYRTDHGLNHALLVKGLAYSLLAITCFHLGATLNYSGHKEKRIKYSQTVVINSFTRIGKILLFVCIPAFLYNVYSLVMAVRAGGYEAYYQTIASRSYFEIILSKIAEFYQPCLLILLIANKNKKETRRLIILAMTVDIVCDLYIGGRSGAVMSILALLLTVHYFVKPFKAKEVVLMLVFGYLGMAVLNTVADTRGLTNRTFVDFIYAFGDGFVNVFGNFIGEMGWSLSSICWTMNLVPQFYPFRFGRSYLVALISPIPNLGIWETHPAKIWGDLGDWLQGALNIDYGPGFTMVAESYINFGWYGLIAMFFIGIILVRLLASVNYKNRNNDILGSTFQIIIIMTIMKSLIRSSMSVVSRTVVFVILPLYILVRLGMRGQEDENRNTYLA